MPPISYVKGARLLDITKASVGTGLAVPVTVVRKQGRGYLVQDVDGKQRGLDSLMLLPDTAQYRAEAKVHYDRLQTAFAKARAKRARRIIKLESELAALRAEALSDKD